MVNATNICLACPRINNHGEYLSNDDGLHSLCVCVCALASAICTMIGLILYNVSHIYFELRAQAYQVSIIMVVVAGGITGYGYLQMHRIFDWFVIESTNVCESPSTSSIYARSFSYIRY